MAHELNQPLTALLASTQAAQRLLGDDEPDLDTARIAMGQAVDQARRASAVVGRLRRVVERPDLSGQAQPLALLAALNDALNLLPPNACPADGVHAGIMALINQIQATPLRSLVESTLQDREVCSRFWTMPASAQHHHAFPGGLATHCLEVAQDLAGQSCLEGHERDLCIAAGLLHDIGKIWAYTQDMFLDTPARAMGHELLGLSRLERNLMALEVDWPDGAYAMRVLLSGCGRMRHDGTMPSALVSRLKAADQRSCENERARREPLRAWRPKRWLSSFIPEDDPTPME